MEKDGNDPKEKKRRRNRLSYTRNRKSILKRARERYLSKKVISFPSQAGRKNIPLYASRKLRKRRSLIGWGVGCYPMFICAIEQIFILGVIIVSTYFLLHETVGFLIQTEGSSTTAWLKAFLVEALIVTLSWLRAPDLGKSDQERSLAIRVGQW